MEKYRGVGEATVNDMALRISRRAPKATNTHAEYVILVFSTATMAARMQLNVTLYLHCLSCYYMRSLIYFDSRC